MVWASSVDPEEQSDQGLLCLPFRLHHAGKYSVAKRYCSSFMVLQPFSGVRIFKDFYGNFLVIGVLESLTQEPGTMKKTACALWGTEIGIGMISAVEKKCISSVNERM